MQAPKYQAPPTDPTVAALSSTAQADDIAATQRTAQIDTSSLMARYGTRLAMGGAVSSPLVAAPTTYGAMR